MKNFSLIIALIFLFALFGIGFYLIFLDNFIKNEFVKQEVKEMQTVIKKSNKQIFQFQNGEELTNTKDYLSEVILNLGINCEIQIENKNTINIKSKIIKSEDYKKIKNFIFFLENNKFKIDSICLGQGCQSYKYGFYAKVRPYKYLKFDD
jgi:hypothetical protein